MIKSLREGGKKTTKILQENLVEFDQIWIHWSQKINDKDEKLRLVWGKNDHIWSWQTNIWKKMCPSDDKNVSIIYK